MAYAARHHRSRLSDRRCGERFRTSRDWTDHIDRSWSRSAMGSACRAPISSRSMSCDRAGSARPIGPPGPRPAQATDRAASATSPSPSSRTDRLMHGLGRAAPARRDDPRPYARSYRLSARPFRVSADQVLHLLPDLGERRVVGPYRLRRLRARAGMEVSEKSGLRALAYLIGDAVELSASSLVMSEATRIAMLNTAPDGVVVVDEAGAILEFNPAAERIFGWRSPGLRQAACRHRRSAATSNGASRILMRRLQQGRAGRMLGQRIETEVASCDGGHRSGRTRDHRDQAYRAAPFRRLCARSDRDANAPRRKWRGSARRCTRARN